MKNNGYVRVAAGIPRVEVADVDFNVSQIKALIEKAYKAECDFIVFPELCVTGYTCQDLFHQEALLEKSKQAVEELQLSLDDKPEMIVIIGAPYKSTSGKLLNTAYILNGGLVEGKVSKHYLPGYKEFYEPRWFSSCKDLSHVFRFSGINFGVEICEDVWSPIPPSSYLVQKGADLIFNLSASNELIGKHDYLRGLLQHHSAQTICGYVYSGAGYGESSQDMVFSGNGFIIENGKVLKEAERFQTDSQIIISDIDVESLRNERMVNTTFQSFLNEIPDPSYSIINCTGSAREKSSSYRNPYNGHPFVPGGKALLDRSSEILEFQAISLARRIDKLGMNPVIGISGGSDSTWALIVAHEAVKKAIKKASIIGVTMPGFATSSRTKNNSLSLMDQYCDIKLEIDITEMCKAELKALGHDEAVQDITYENVQARSRTQILMNISNQKHGFVIGTGDLSELALGWCTYNGDQQSMYGVNCSVPKTLIKSLIKWYNQNRVPQKNQWLLNDILNTPVSPELKGTGADTSKSGAQVTENEIGPYELHDFYLYNMLRHGFGPKKLLWIAQHSDLTSKYSLSDMKKWLRVFIQRFFSQQFKRNNLPDGPKIGSISLSQRGDWRMPSDATAKAWLDELD